MSAAASSSTPGSSSTSSGHAEVKSLLHQRLIESGEKERLKEHLKTRLVECGWRDQLKLSAKEIIRQKGLEHVKLDELIAEITPKGRASVPDAVKRELLARIKDFLAQQENI